MSTTSEKITKQKMVLAEAVVSATKRLGITQSQLISILNINSIEDLEIGLDPTSVQAEIVLSLIRISTSLDSLTGGNTAWMQHFMKSSSKLTNGIPIEQIQTAQGLFSILYLLEALRTKL